jgi:GntR family transcriptional regulator, transcriptional repressor for pyruvate dehydrogenase complex
MFNAIAPRESAVDACARELRRVILSGELGPGDRLPPERRLAESFGVNRMTLRGALGQLAAAGLLEVRQGRGYEICDYRAEGGPELLPGLGELATRPSERAAMVDDLLRVRRHLARAVLEKLTELEVDALPVRAAVDAFAAAVEKGDMLAVAEADLGIVRALLAATQSAVLQLCSNPVERAVRQWPWLRAAIYAEPRDNLAGWWAMLAWLEGERDRGSVERIAGLLEARDQATVERIRKTRIRKATP